MRCSHIYRPLHHQMQNDGESTVVPGHSPDTVGSDTSRFQQQVWKDAHEYLLSVMVLHCYAPANVNSAMLQMTAAHREDPRQGHK